MPLKYWPAQTVWSCPSECLLLILYVCGLLWPRYFCIHSGRKGLKQSKELKALWLAYPELHLNEFTQNQSPIIHCVCYQLQWEDKREKGWPGGWGLHMPSWLVVRTTSITFEFYFLNLKGELSVSLICMWIKSWLLVLSVFWAVCFFLLATLLCNDISIKLPLQSGWTFCVWMCMEGERPQSNYNHDRMVAHN